MHVYARIGAVTSETLLTALLKENGRKQRQNEANPGKPSKTSKNKIDKHE